MCEFVIPCSCFEQMMIMYIVVLLSTKSAVGITHISALHKTGTLLHLTLMLFAEKLANSYITSYSCPFKKVMLDVMLKGT